MINVTELLKNTKDFNPNNFITHLRHEALINAKFRRTEQGWFNKRGQWLGKTDEAAIKSTGLTYDSIPATIFYAIHPDDIQDLQRGVVAKVHGVYIWGTYDVDQ